MNQAPFRSAILASAAAVLATQGAVQAQSQSIGEADTSGWFVRLSAVARFNVKASVDSVSARKAPGVYDDGFVLPDNGGGNQTWNWGFDPDAQVAGNDLVLTSLDDVPAIDEEEFDVSSPIFGGEVVAGYRLAGFEMGKRIARLGFELGVGYSGFSENVRADAFGAARFTTDRFGLGGIIPPVAPYKGTATGPGPLINLNPNPGGSMLEVDAPGASRTSFDGSLDASFYSFRIGPTFEVDLTPRLSLALGGGYSSVYVDSRLKYDEVITFANPDLPAQTPTRENITEGDWRIGAYFEARINYRLSRHTDLFAGFDFQHNSKFTFGDSKYEATIDLGATYGVKTGIAFWF